MTDLDVKSYLHKLGELVRSAREALMLSVSELAARADVDKGTISRLEHGRVRPERKTLNSIYRALDAGLQKKGTRREFLAVATKLGIVISAAPIFSAAEEQDRGEFALPFWRRLGLEGEISPPKLAAALPIFRVLTYNGAAPMVAERCAQLTHEIETSPWAKSTEASILLSKIYKELAFAYIEALPPSRYEAVIQAVWESQSYASDGALPRWKRDSLYTGGELALGVALRILDEEMRGSTDAIHRRTLRTLYDDAVELYPHRHPLFLVIDHAARAQDYSEDLADQLWARSELMKLTMGTGDWQEFERQFELAQRKLATSELQPSGASAIVPFLIYEAHARGLIRMSNVPAAARDSLSEAGKRAPFKTSEFQTQLTHCELLLVSGTRSTELDGIDYLQELIRVAPSAYQKRKATRLAERFRVPPSTGTEA